MTFTCQVQQSSSQSLHLEANTLAVGQGVNKLGDKMSESKCALVYGQMNEPPGARARVALTGAFQLMLLQQHLTAHISMAWPAKQFSQ